MRIVLVRHGHPDYDNDCLTPLGHLQAKAAAERLRNEGIQKIYTSPMGRARQTAEYASELLGIKPIEVLDFMHEIEWGDKNSEQPYEDGSPWEIADELVRQNRDLTDKNWPEYELFKNNIATDEVKKVAVAADEWLKTLGYEREGFYYRNNRKDDSQYTVALFCHGGSSSALISHILNQTFPYVCATWHTDFTAVSVLRFDRIPGSLAMPCFEISSDSRHINGIKL